MPNALLPDGLRVLTSWGFEYKSNLVWHKVRKDGGSDGRGVGFYFRNVTELVLFGVRGKNARTLAPGRRQVNYLATRKREHSRKPDELYSLIEACSCGPYLELFARGARPSWTVWGNQRSGNTNQPGRRTPITLLPSGGRSSRQNEGPGRTRWQPPAAVNAAAPDIVEAILDGLQPKGMALEELTGTIPSSWEEQKKPPIPYHPERTRRSTVRTSPDIR